MQQRTWEGKEPGGRGWDAVVQAPRVDGTGRRLRSAAESL